MVLNIKSEEQMMTMPLHFQYLYYSKYVKTFVQGLLLKIS